LRQALQVNELFIAVLGHDLRTPLSSVVMHGAELIQLLCKDAKVADAAKRIYSSGDRMEKMVRQLLDVAQIRSGGITMFKARSDYKTVCKRIIEEVQAAYPSADIRLECRGDLTGAFDTDRMSQILSNLATNTVQHGEPGAPVLLTIDGSQAQQLLARVHNRGSIPAETLERIFKPFHSANTGRPARNGLGLGLYILKQFVEAHGGRVMATSSQNDGTCFEIVLPR
jgi:two-component system sensor histidine kinase/response regulator